MFITFLTRGEIDPFTWTDCKLGFFLMYFGMKYSSSLVVIITVEKFIALYFPLQSKYVCTLGIARRVSLVTAVVFIIFDSQFFFIGIPIPEQYYIRCGYGNAPKLYRDILFLGVTAVFYSYGPFLIILVMNFAILFKVYRLKSRKRGMVSESENQSLRADCAIRGTFTLLGISVVFILCTCPICISNILSLWREPPPALLAVGIISQYLNHALNCVVYSVMGSRFRNQMRDLLYCRVNVLQSSRTTPTTQASTM